MATVTHAGTGIWITTAGTTTTPAFTGTPAVGDLIVVVAASTGVATSAVTDNNSGGTYTQVDTDRTGFSTSGHLSVWVRNALITSATSTVFTAPQNGSTGGGLDVFRISGMTRTGAIAVRQTAGQSTGTSGTAPAPVMGVAVLTGNPVIGAVCCGTNATTNFTPRTSFTEASDLGYSTPATGLETMFRSSGETGTTLTWGSNAPSAFASVVVELDTSAPTTAVLATGTGAALNLVPPIRAVLATGVGKAFRPQEMSPPLELSGFGTFTGVGSGDTINTVTVTINEFASNALMGAPLVELWDYSGTPARVGAAQPGTASVSQSNVDTFVFTGVSYAMLATLRVRIYAHQGTALSGTVQNVNWAGLTVNYIPAGGLSVLARVATGTGTAQSPSAVSASSAPSAVATGTGTARSPAPAAGVNAGLASGTGTAGTAVATPPYTIFSGALPPAGGSAGDLLPYTIATQFTVAAAVPLQGVWFYSPPGATALPQVTGIFDTGSQTLVTGSQNSSPSWSGAAGSGWVYAATPGGVLLSPGHTYAAAVAQSGSVAWYWQNGSYWSAGGPGQSGLTNGQLSALSAAAAAGGLQCGFHAGGTLTYPTSVFSASNYWIDVQVGAPVPVTAVPATGSGAAGSPVAAAGVSAVLAAGAGAAQNVSASTSASGTANAGLATGSGTAGGPVAAAGVDAVLAAGTGAAGSPVAAAGVSAAAAAGVSAAGSPVAAAGVNAAAAAGTGAAQGLVAAAGVDAVLAAGTGAAQNATAGTAASGTGTAAAATGTGAAQGPVTAVGVNAGAGPAAGAAQGLVAAAGVNAGLAAGSGAALAVPAAGAVAGLASGAGVTGGGSASAAAAPAAGAASGTAAGGQIAAGVAVVPAPAAAAGSAGSASVAGGTVNISSADAGHVEESAFHYITGTGDSASGAEGTLPFIRVRGADRASAAERPLSAWPSGKDAGKAGDHPLSAWPAAGDSARAAEGWKPFRFSLSDSASMAEVLHEMGIWTFVPVNLRLLGKHWRVTGTDARGRQVTILEGERLSGAVLALAERVSWSRVTVRVDSADRCASAEGLARELVAVSAWVTASVAVSAWAEGQ